MQRKSGKFELEFWGGSAGIRYRRFHSTYQSAKETAQTILAKMENRGAHPAMIHDPSGKQIRTIR